MIVVDNPSRHIPTYHQTFFTTLTTMLYGYRNRTVLLYPLVRAGVVVILHICS
jgi:hypothetical protein